MPGANKSVVVEIEEKEPDLERFGHPQKSPDQSNEAFPNGIERLAMSCFSA